MDGVAAPLRLLVVDDDAVDRTAVRRALTQAGMTVSMHEAEGASDALALLDADEFDCVLLDYTIPGSDGLTVLRELKALRHALPVVMLTGQGDEQVAVELMKAGAADYLAKGSLTPERLAKSLHYAVELARSGELARRAESERIRSTERTDRLQRVTSRLASALGTHEVARRFVSDVREAVRADSAWLALIAPNQDTLIGLAGSGLSDESTQERFALSAPLIVTGVARTGEPQYFSSPDEIEHVDGSLSEMLEGQRPSALLVVPLDAGDGPIGVLAAGFREMREFSAADRAFVTALAGQCAAAMDRARLYEAEQQSRASAERLAARLAGAARAIIRQGDIDAVLREITEQARSIVGAHQAIITLAAADDLTPPLRAISSSEQYARWRDFADVPVSRDRLAAPLIGHEGGHLGAIELCDKTEGDFTAADESVLAQLAEMAAAAVENARLRERAEAARLQAEEANRAKSEFLARMSHDLRTPLNAIGGHAQLLELGVHGAMTEAQREALGRVRRAQKHLLTLINDILSFARLGAGEVRIMADDFAVAPVLQELAALVRPEIEAHGLTLHIDAGDPNLAVRADRERLVQVLLNLTSNALKFTPAGGVRISSDATADSVRLHVHDTGLGVPPHKLESIFEAFVQARDSIIERQGGVGLGLAISRELARRMGGNVTVTSVEGVGSTFTVHLPRVVG